MMSDDDVAADDDDTLTSARSVPQSPIESIPNIGSNPQPNGRITACASFSRAASKRVAGMHTAVAAAALAVTLTWLAMFRLKDGIAWGAETVALLT